METKKIAYMALWMLVWWILVVGAGTYATSGRSISMHWIGFGWWRGWFERTGSGWEATFAKLVSKTVVNTASWVEVTLTTTDSWALAHIQAMSEFMLNKKPLDQTKVTLTSVKLDNWVKLTIVWSDADTIKKIQDVAANSNWLFPMWGWKWFKPWMMKDGKWFGKSGSGSFGQSAFDKLVTKTIVNTASWVESTLTTTDSGALARLQSMATMMNSKPHPDAEKITITSVKIDNGIKLTITWSDADTIKKIQEKAASGKWFFPMWEGKWMMRGGKWGFWGWFDWGMMRGWR
ncbi:MAG: hypothetical protein ACD_2C00207G0006 [uncultured bacterium (gcode 4)]|uniref:Uncharacterized protein n=1 Tax=uncultured bacterium (gcode 4) TaxID=1234023 RepID=K2H0C4_9BACT|nr:MAG: hypothetical protein ACD_2C00207G0006 [uncultured bacterium (gcode 4)]